MMKLGKVYLMITLWLFASALVGCASSQGQTPTEGHEGEMLSMPELASAGVKGEKLMVVATTSIIGDVVGQVGGDGIELVVLMAPGQDPHSFVPAARDLTAVAQAQVIFTNGWDLEEALVEQLRSISEGVPLVPVSANIEPLEFTGQEEDGHAHAVDPHTWQSVKNVMQWVQNIEQALSVLDPAHASLYQANAAAYLAQLDELHTYAQSTLGGIPVEKRLLVTNHNTLGYFAREYGFEVIGTVIPASSTLAEPSANELAALIETLEANHICTLFTETTMSISLADTLASELTGCSQVQVLQLYTDSVGPVGSGADTYLSMFRNNVDTIAAGLK